MPHPPPLPHHHRPAIFGGKPIVRGRRFAVEHLIGYLDAGMSELLAEFPFLELDDIAAAKPSTQDVSHSSSAQR